MKHHGVDPVKYERFSRFIDENDDAGREPEPGTGGRSQVVYGGDTLGGHPSVGGAAEQSQLLAQLSEMRDDGILTDEQFETQKNRLLG